MTHPSTQTSLKQGYASQKQKKKKRLTTPKCPTFKAKMLQ